MRLIKAMKEGKVMTAGRFDDEHIRIMKSLKWKIIDIRMNEAAQILKQFDQTMPTKKNYFYNGISKGSKDETKQTDWRREEFKTYPVRM